MGESPSQGAGVRPLVDVRNKIIDRTDLPRIRAVHRAQRIVFCSGCFDVLHAGHAVFLNQCAGLGDVLVAGVGRDSVLRALKGPTRPINAEPNRLYLVANMGNVDYALLTDELENDSDVNRILGLLRPDVFAVADGDVMAIRAEKELCRRLGIRMITLPRTVPERLIRSSSTEILTKLADQ